jgi:hypothetical protein
MSFVPETPLTAIAEIGIAFIGFTGIIFMLTKRVRAEEKYRLVFLVLLATQITFCALIPFGIEGYAPNSEFVWRISLVIFGVSSLSFSANALKGIITGGLSTQTPVFRLLLLAVGIAIGFLAVMSGFSIILSPTHSLLVICLIWNILSLISLFVFTLQYLWREDSDDA